MHVAGIDGTPGGWAVVVMGATELSIQKVPCPLSNFLLRATNFEIIAIDVPIGLLETYEAGGRVCDRAARNILGRPRASSVFPAPVRAVLAAKSWPEACVKSRGSAPHAKGISKQTFAILPKIREIDAILQTHLELRHVIREVHPEVSFCALVGGPMGHSKRSALGRNERRQALSRMFPRLHEIEKSGRGQGLPIEDILDAAIACWSAQRLASGKARSLPGDIPLDATELPMTIWA